MCICIYYVLSIILLGWHLHKVFAAFSTIPHHMQLSGSQRRQHLSVLQAAREKNRQFDQQMKKKQKR